MNSCSCLTLILACIIYWQANAIAERVRSGAAAEEGIDTRLLRHVSPIEWDRSCPALVDSFVVGFQAGDLSVHSSLSAVAGRMPSDRRTGK